MLEFKDPDWDAPLDLKQWIRETPDHAVTKGMFFTSLIDTVKFVGARMPPSRRFVSFKDYPLHEWMKLAVDCSRIAFPKLSIREGLRRMGHAVYPMFSKTIVGTAIFAVAINDVTAVIRLASRAYRVSLKPGQLELEEIADRRAVLTLREVYSFCDSYHVGIWEGMLQMFNYDGRVRICQHSICDADIEVTW